MANGNSSSVSSNGQNASQNVLTATAVSSRRKYGKYSYQLKKLVLRKFRDGLNWKETANDNQIPHSTVYRWSKMQCDEEGVPIFAAKGGAINVKILQEHKDYIVTLLEDPVADINT